MTISSFSKKLIRHIIWLGRWAQTPPGLYIGIALAMFIFVLLTVVAPHSQNRQASRNAAKATATTAQILGSQSQRLLTDGSSSGLTPGRTLTVRTFINQFDNAAGVWAGVKLPKAPFIWPTIVPPLWYPGRYYQDVAATAHDQNELKNDTDKSLKTARALVLHQQKVYQALRQILGYDASADMSSFNLADDDTKKRLELAQNGLSSAKQQLEAARSNDDPTLGALIDRIATLQTSRDQLAAGTTSPSDWVAAFSLAQADIVINRDKYWQTASAPLAASLAQASEQYQDLSESWTRHIEGH